MLRTIPRPRPVTAAAAVTLSAALALGLSACSTVSEKVPAATDGSGPLATGAAAGAAGENPTGSAPGSVDTAGGFAAIPDIAAQVEPSVVTVVVGRSGLGSGVVYRDGGYVVTNAHVVRDAREVELQLADGSRTQAQVLATDEITDVAVLRAQRRDLPPATFEATLPRAGELVLALGSPLGFSNSVTAGIVSGLGRQIPGAATRGSQSLVDLIQTDAAISPGNSGGALVNADAEVVGLNEAYIPPSAGAVSLGFAIPAGTVVDIADQLLADGTATHPYIGITLATLTPQVAQALGLSTDEGVLIQSVQPDGPAEAAGLQQGDVIKSFDGQRVDSGAGLLGALRSVDPGDTAQVTVVREGDRRDVTLTVGDLDRDGPG